MELLKKYLDEWQTIARQLTPGKRIATPHLYIPAKFEQDNGFNGDYFSMIKNEKWINLMSDHPVLLLVECAAWKMTSDNPDSGFFDKIKQVILETGIQKEISKMMLRSGGNPDILTVFCSTCMMIVFPGKYDLSTTWYKDKDGMTAPMKDVLRFYVDYAKLSKQS